MYCPQCGNVISENSKFCGECGFSIPSAQEISTDALSPSADALLTEMFPTITEENENVELTEKTDKIEQNDNNRLFLDDEEDDNEEDNSDAFFSNLVALNENEEMISNDTSYFQTSDSKKIAPVFEEVPDINVVEAQMNTQYEELESDEDDYSNIVIGDTTPPAIEPSIEMNVTENVIENNSDNIAENNVAETPATPIVQQETQPTEQIIPPVIEQNPNEPVLFIDNSQPTTPQIMGEYNVDINEENQTPYLDKFIPHQNADVDFEIPANMENSNVVPQDTNMENNIQPVSQDIGNIPQQDSFVQPQSFQQPTQSVEQAQSAKPKKSKAPLIITLSIIGVLIIGLATSAFLFRDNIISLFNPPAQEEVIDSNEDKNNTTEDETKNEVKPIVDNNPQWEILSSTEETPLVVGQASKVSKYIDDTKCYSELQMSIKKIHRGEDALALAREYEENSTVVFEAPQDGIEYVVVEYDVYIPMEISTTGTTANIPLEVRGLSTNGIIFNNNSYVISTWCIDKGEKSITGEKVTCMDIFQMPVGCTDYYLVFGTDGYTTTVYKGE